MPKLLLVEDEKSIAEGLAITLEAEGFQVAWVKDGLDAIPAWERVRPDLVVLDLMLPGMSGTEICRTLRSRSDVPIIMLTARTLEDDKIRGFDSGVDDYITKPFASREMIARIHAVLRRASPAGTDDEVVADGLALNVASHRVLAKGRPVELGPTEYRMLKFFMTHQDRVYSRAQLLDHVWGGGVYVEERTVDVHILRLRKALAPHGHDGCVQTVRGAGYRFSVTGNG